MERERNERIERFLAANPDLPPAHVLALRKGEVKIGMTPDEVRAVWGVPDHHYESGGIGGGLQSLDYGQTSFYFSDGKLARWSSAR